MGWARYDARGMQQGDVRCCTPMVRIAIAAPSRVAGCCSAVMAWYSAICWRERPICRAGGNCRLLSGGWKIAARFEADGLSMDFWANSLRCQSRWNLCAPLANFQLQANASL